MRYKRNAQIQISQLRYRYEEARLYGAAIVVCGGVNG